MTRPPRAVDERRQPPGREPDWSEWAHFEWFAADGSSGGWIRVTVHPHGHRSTFRAAVVAPARPVAVIVDDELPLPSPDGTWEIRGPGLWVDLVCEVPLDHWSVGLEAFAVGLDDPDEIFRSGRGERVPLGLDLGFEDLEPAAWLDADRSSHGSPARVEGDVLWGPDRLTIDGWGWRSRGTGPAFGSRPTTELALRHPDGSWSTGHDGGVDRPPIDRALDAPVPEAGGRWHRSLVSGLAGQGWIGSWLPD